MLLPNGIVSVPFRLKMNLYASYCGYLQQFDAHFPKFTTLRWNLTRWQSLSCLTSFGFILLSKWRNTEHWNTEQMEHVQSHRSFIQQSSQKVTVRYHMSRFCTMWAPCHWSSLSWRTEICRVRTLCNPDVRFWRSTVCLLLNTECIAHANSLFKVREASFPTHKHRNRRGGDVGLVICWILPRCHMTLRFIKSFSTARNWSNFIEIQEMETAYILCMGCITFYSRYWRRGSIKRNTMAGEK